MLLNQKLEHLVSWNVSVTVTFNLLYCTILDVNRLFLLTSVFLSI